VNPELIDVESSASKWSQTFEAGISDVFQVQSDIAGRVAQALDVALGAGTEQRLAARPTRNLDAYDAFLKGEEITDRLGKIDESVLRQALVYYQRAVSLDSTFAKAWSSMAVSYTELVRSNPSVEGNELARGAAERALALDPASPEARMAMGRYLHIVAKDYARALEQYTLGLKANPNNAGSSSSRGHGRAGPWPVGRSRGTPVPCRTARSPLGDYRACVRAHPA
jgi:tetratricopeptide (TPR) repeat protein